MTKKIIILGSRPSAIIPAGDIIYCANAAGGHYRNEIKHFSKIISVVAGSQLKHNKRKPGSKNSHFFDENLSLIKKSRSQEIIVSVLKEELADTNEIRKFFRGNIVEMTGRQRRNIIYNASGVREPILARQTLEEINALNLSQKSQFLKNFIYKYLRALWDPYVEFPSPCRPSTGIFALAIAIGRHGLSAEYHIAGIGFENRNEYLNGKLEKVDRQFTNHVFADLVVLKKIQERHQVKFTDAAIAKKYCLD